jgi:hypothetical protein
MRVIARGEAPRENPGGLDSQLTATGQSIVA